jgi:hypothetical protein
MVLFKQAAFGLGLLVMTPILAILGLLYGALFPAGAAFNAYRGIQGRLEYHRYPRSTHLAILRDAIIMQIVMAGAIATSVWAVLNWTGVQLLFAVIAAFFMYVVAVVASFSLANSYK